MSSFGQSKKQKQLEEKRLRILKDIREVNAFINNNKQESTSLLTKIEDLNLKIKVRKNLIQVTNEQANLLTREIKNNNISSQHTTFQKLIYFKHFLFTWRMQFLHYG